MAQLAADAADVPLCNALQTARVRLADGKPAYIVFDNKTLTAISKARPATAAQLRAVPGIGADKVRKYGDDILRCVEENPRPGGGSAAAEAAAAAAAAAAAEAAAQPAVALNSEQSRALDLALRGESLFLTGGAGTGKSFTLNHIVKALKQQRGEGQVFVTASTGIAACHIGGTTLHSFAGVGLARESASDLASRVMGNRVDAAVDRRVRPRDRRGVDARRHFLRQARRDRPHRPRRPRRQALRRAAALAVRRLLPAPSGRAVAAARCASSSSAVLAKVVAHTVVLRQVFRQADAAFVTLLEEMRPAASPFHVSLLGRSVRPPGAPPSTRRRRRPPPPPPSLPPVPLSPMPTSPAGPSPATAAPEAAGGRRRRAVASGRSVRRRRSRADPEATAEAMKVEAKPGEGGGSKRRRRRRRRRDRRTRRPRRSQRQ